MIPARSARCRSCSLWQKPRAKLIVINFDYRPFPLKWLLRWICPMRALKGKLLTSASANASSRFISDIPFFSFSNWFLVQIQTLCINSLQGFYAIFLGFWVALWKTWKHYGNDQGQFLCSLFKYQLGGKKPVMLNHAKILLRAHLREGLSGDLKIWPLVHDGF